MKLVRVLLLAAFTAAILWLPLRAHEQPLRIFIRAGEKTHGPAGNDQHDYPKFLNEWTQLLSDRGAKVEGALRFPTADELARTDVLIIFKGDGGTCSREERTLLEDYTKRGGGLVVLHDGMCSDDPAWFATLAGGAKKHGEMNWSRGLLKMQFGDNAHPVAAGLRDFEVNDEAFFLLQRAPGMRVLATAPLPLNGEVTPQVWTYERTIPGGQPYRSFVSMIGHYYRIFSEPTHRALVLRGIAWAGKRDVNLLQTPLTNGQATTQPAQPQAPSTGSGQGPSTGSGQGRGAGRGGGRGGGVAVGLFNAADENKDATVTRAELKKTFDDWYTQWDTAKTGSLSREDLGPGVMATLIRAFGAPAGRGGGQNQTPNPSDVQAMTAALPDQAPAKPKQPRRVLVLGRAAGFVHSSIPLAARTIEEMGKKTGAWSTTITYDAADISEQNLKQYDAIVLSSTTGNFLDDPKDEATTAARRKAFLDFVRNGKGLAGIHAASDSYHREAPSADRETTAGGRGGRGGGGGGFAAPLVEQIVTYGDTNGDSRLTRAEFASLADNWYDTMDPQNTGRVGQQEFVEAFNGIMPPPPAPALGPAGFPIQPAATPEQLRPDTQVGTWPEFNRMIGAFFKWHWNDGQLITYKIDEPGHPINAPFTKLKEPFEIVDETYTFGRDTYSRQNLRVLTSVDYSKMSAEDKAKEQFPRNDGDYALSWIRREGKGRVFYEAHGHSERVYAMRPFLEHVLYGMQYVLGDLPADDSPSRKGESR